MYCTGTWVKRTVLSVDARKRMIRRSRSAAVCILAACQSNCAPLCTNLQRRSKYYRTALKGAGAPRAPRLAARPHPPVEHLLVGLVRRRLQLVAACGAHHILPQGLPGVRAPGRFPQGHVQQVASAKGTLLILVRSVSCCAAGAQAHPALLSSLQASMHLLRRCADATAGKESLGCRAVHAAWQRFTAVKRRQTSARAARAQALKLPWRSSMTLLKTSTSAGSSGLRAGAVRHCSKPRLQPDRAWTHFLAPYAPRRRASLSAAGPLYT